MQVVINRKYGGFGLSRKAIEYLKENYDFDENYYFGKIDRTHEGLIEVVEKFGNQANGRFARLEIVEIPDNIDWEIVEYDGKERVQERTKEWY